MEQCDLPEAGGSAADEAVPAEADAFAAPPDADLSAIPPSRRGIRRKRLVPLWTIVSASVAAVLLLGAAVALPLVLRGRRVAVPSVVGLQYETAAARLREAGLEPRRGDERFSADAAENSVVEQSPAAGTEVASGTEIVLTVSAGSETFAMPDVVGRQLDDARRLLTERGLAVRVDVVPSEAASGTVISTVPAPGVTVTTSDLVRLTVAGSGEASSALLPYRLDGLSFAIDPTPVASGTVDAPLEVARRLRSLLEASGATVTVTRSFRDPSPSVRERVDAAREATPTAVIGIVLASRGEGGMSVTTPPASQGRSRLAEETEALAQRIAAELRAGRRVVSVATEEDRVLAAIDAPGARLRLGSAASREDVLSFRDPRWTDEVARALYRAVGEVFAPE